MSDLKDHPSTFGRSASDALAVELAKFGAYEIVPRDDVVRAIAALGLDEPLTPIIDLARIGQTVRANVIVSGDIVDYRINQGGPAQAAVRVVPYDVANGLPVNGPLEIGKADLHGGGREPVLREAIGRAVVQAVTTMQRRRMPRAATLGTTSGAVTIDRGSWVGFRKGMRVFVMDGSIAIGLARVMGRGEPRRDRFRRTRDGLVTGQARPCRLRSAVGSTL